MLAMSGCPAAGGWILSLHGPAGTAFAGCCESWPILPSGEKLRYPRIWQVMDETVVEYAASGQGPMAATGGSPGQGLAPGALPLGPNFEARPRPCGRQGGGG